MKKNTTLTLVRTLDKQEATPAAPIGQAQVYESGLRWTNNRRTFQFAGPRGELIAKLEVESCMVDDAVLEVIEQLQQAMLAAGSGNAQRAGFSLS